MVEYPIELKLPLLGSRDYLQGSTLLDGLLPYIPARARVGLNLRHLIYSDRVQFELADRGAEGSLDASLRYRSGSQSEELGVRGLPRSSEPLRIPYDESLITRDARFDGHSVDHPGSSPFSFTANLVSLNKALLHRILPQGGEGRWLFVRLDLASVPSQPVPIHLSCKGAQFGGRIARSKVVLAGEPAGDLYFSWLDTTSAPSG